MGDYIPTPSQEAHAPSEGRLGSDRTQRQPPSPSPFLEAPRELSSDFISVQSSRPGGNRLGGVPVEVSQGNPKREPGIESESKQKHRFLAQGFPTVWLRKIARKTTRASPTPTPAPLRPFVGRSDDKTPRGQGASRHVTAQGLRSGLGRTGVMTETWEGSPKLSTMIKTPPVRLDLASNNRALCTGSALETEEVSAATAKSLVTHHVCPLPAASEDVAGLAMPRRNPSRGEHSHFISEASEPEWVGSSLPL